jgi:hypothetical protein
MSRLFFISLVLLAGFFFTQCQDDCGSSYSSPGRLIGISGIQTQARPLRATQPSSHIDSFGIQMVVDFLFAQQESKWSLINTAYACSPPPEPRYDVSQYIDSIKVFSEPNYGSLSEITTLLSYEQSMDLSDYNSFQERAMLESYGFFYLKEKPIVAADYTFFFYYYKDGVITDSSFTQKYFISN